MSDPSKKTETPAQDQAPSEKQAADLPEDLELDPEPEGDIGKMVERGRQMGF